MSVTLLRNILVVGLLALGLAACGSSAGNGSPGGSGGSSSAGTGGAGGGASAGHGGAGTGSAGTTGVAGTTGIAGTGGASGGGAAGVAGATGGSAGGAAAGRGGGPGGTGGAAGAAQCPATATATPGETTQSIMVGGMTRSFVRHIPPGYTGRTPVPVVIDFHPLGGTGATWKGSGGWGALADSQGFIAIWPDGVAMSWNVGRCCSTAQSQNVDDVAFTRAIISTLATQACIDSKRVYATGCSNGGGMAFKVACDAADMIAAVAPVDFDCVTGSASTPSCGSCSPARPISEIQFRGTNDSAVPFTGGSGPRGTVFPGAQRNFTDWGGINMCTGSPQALPDHPACQAFPSCGGGVETALCTVQNGTHCGSYQSFGIAAIAWQLFQTKALP